MIIVDNFEKIKNLLRFDPNKKTLVLIWVVVRRKDGIENAKGNNKNRTIASYYIKSPEEFDAHKYEIETICNSFHARAYICLNPKPIMNVLFNLQDIVNGNIKCNVFQEETPIHLKGIIESAIMKAVTKMDKYWVIDVDTKNEDCIKHVKDIVDHSRSKFSSNVIDEIPTIHGCHLITHTFDAMELEKYAKNLEYEVEVKKDALTLLYASVPEEIEG